MNVEPYTSEDYSKLVSDAKSQIQVLYDECYVEPSSWGVFEFGFLFALDVLIDIEKRPELLSNISKLAPKLGYADQRLLFAVLTQAIQDHIEDLIREEHEEKQTQTAA